MHALMDHYRKAKDWVCNSQFSEELRWQESLSLDLVDESQFLREYAWVVLNSGFREAVVRQRFNYISLCFCDWESAGSIAERGQVCIETALAVFRHRGKLEAIALTARRIANDGFGELSASLRRNPTFALRQFPYIGAITSLHLAKNLGAEVAKPDRHLVRVANRFGYSDPGVMCQDISTAIGDRVSVADLVLWRFEERGIRTAP
jgi:hypothetical protein